MSVLDSTKSYQKYFEQITQIPHGSGNEKQISDFLVQFASEHQLKVIQDAYNNVFIIKNASAGYETHEAVILQAHIDMVDEKNADIIHDFTKDPLQLRIEDGFLYANGTTLGADDGAGVAYIMAVLADDTLKHPRINALFTVNEEATMEGAFKFDEKLFEGRRLINIDAEEEDSSNTASAGGMDVFVSHPLKMSPSLHPGYQLSVKGLLGGHSGGEIHKERANANKLVSRILHSLQKEGECILASFQGGLKINAIPREAIATFTYNNITIKDQITKLSEIIKKEFEYTDPNIIIELSESKISEVMDKDSSDAIINLVYLMPTGFRHKSDELQGLTTASENIGTITTDGNSFNLGISVRGALDSYVQDLAEEILTLAKILNFDAKTDNWYPAWDFMAISPLRDTMAKVYKDTHNGKELQLYAVHGGLECGIFKGKCHDMDIITMGPNIYDVHSPQENLDLASFDRTYKFLCTLLENL